MEPIAEDTTVWLCLCIKNDCAMSAFGPYASERSAQLEAACGCIHAHVVRRCRYGELKTVPLWYGTVQNAEDRDLYNVWWNEYGVTMTYPEARLLPTEREERVAWDTFLGAVNGF